MAVFASIPERIEDDVRPGAAVSECAIMQQCIGLPRLGIGRVIPARLEMRMRIAQFVRATPQIMNERIDLRLRNVRIGFQIPVRIEQRMRRSAIQRAFLEEVRQRAPAFP